MSYITHILTGEEVKYPEDVARIVKVAFEHGYVLTRQQAVAVWELYSDNMAAEWMTLPKSDEELWEIIG